MDIQPNDILIMKKKHPCGDNRMLVIRSGIDFKLRCVNCSREFLTPRSKIEKSIKKVVKSSNEPQGYSI
jgi:hypothetical protein